MKYPITKDDALKMFAELKKEGKQIDLSNINLLLLCTQKINMAYSEGYRDGCFNLQNGVEIELMCAFLKANTIFQEIVSTIFEYSDPNIDEFKETYSAVQQKVFIVSDYLFKIKEIIDEIDNYTSKGETMIKALEGESIQ